jgi:hypothetical protein
VDVDNRQKTIHWFKIWKAASFPQCGRIEFSFRSLILDDLPSIFSFFEGTTTF